jgi:Anti-sigma factor NepR
VTPGISFVQAMRWDLPMAMKSKNGEGKQAAMARDSIGARGLDARSLEAIGRSLKAHYEDLVRAPVPGKFLEMLDRLESTEQSKPQGSDERG